jgi:hypothetical protein
MNRGGEGETGGLLPLIRFMIPDLERWEEGDGATARGFGGAVAIGGLAMGPGTQKPPGNDGGCLGLDLGEPPK